MDKDKTSLYLLSIVGIVAVVGIVVLVLNAGIGGMYVSEDLGGQAIALKPGLSTASSSLLKPDLIAPTINGITVTFKDEGKSSTATAVVTFTITNEGVTAIPLGTKITHGFLLYSYESVEGGGTSFSTDDVYFTSTSALGAGKTITGTVSFDLDVEEVRKMINGQKEEFLVLGYADIDKMLVESDETNNREYGERFVVTPSEIVVT